MRKVKGSENVLYFFGDDTWRRIKKSAVRYERKGSPLSSSFSTNSALCPALSTLSLSIIIRERIATTNGHMDCRGERNCPW